ncbi:MFS transporter, NNP family, nitrate/nitrite transporter [Algoriphagus faecimaris]|uniref:MFS transporter, NNP family, nitrate/nitrite transporter n=1 Tax=Algoriphagus faecimaris TaxID=686796 RepID=A0A1G6XWS0_9BACT|nr:MFS transporter [Algoriphagus faecimaris]SDD82472.1 MFS transporter, NNP family, nitrate/nitrite transporter [Algoriphagus faecimaris]
MSNAIPSGAHRILFLNTLAFTLCFAAWTFNGVMVTYLVDNGVFDWSQVQIGWLLGIPILTGSVMRLPLGILTDKYGGKWIFVSLLALTAIPMFLLSFTESFTWYAVMSFGFGLAGAGFAVGIGYTSVWYPKHWQGRALGIFGAGNAGAAITTLMAPSLLNSFTSNGQNPEQWKILPLIYAAVLVGMAVLFALFAKNKKPISSTRTIAQTLQPLGNIRVWRFGLYYFLVFGCFVAFSQWLVPYFTNVYGTSLVIAGLFASLFSLPSGIIRALGGWMSDKFGARRVMFGVFKWSIAISALLMIPKMEIFSPGKGINANQKGIVEEVDANEIRMKNGKVYTFSPKTTNEEFESEKTPIFPKKSSWQEAIVQSGDAVEKKQLLVKGITRINFEANMWVFAVLTMIIGIVWGIGKASVYKFIPDYFPNEVGVVGGMVGVIGGMGGFFCPIIFGYLLEGSGLWTSSWMLMLGISIICYLWMSRVVKAILNRNAPELSDQIEHR